ncbi:NADPH:quinone oxidoreductase family protein [Aestuariibius sp. HNIBRBA575]|uniref:NADPH:quinone oxidoreductase family protein n=1 Tax=Aestuariibius sp. HNIBRBA575 TaxID=3233343 RepID=UPI0034A4D8F1
MRAYQTLSFDTPPQLVDVPLTIPVKGEVLVNVEACGLNFADLLMTRGQYQDTPEPPFTLGLEICGTVAQLGPDTKGPAIGTRVAIFGGQGGLAEQGCFDVSRCVPVPDSMSSTVAAGFMVAYGTSHLALSRRARLQPGETLLVTGAAGGVGLTAVEIGKRMGARVIGLARGAEKCAIAQQAGADHVFDSGDPDLLQKLKDLGGVDVVYEAIGGDLFKTALRACNREARILAIGFAGGDVPQVPANHLLVKNVDVIGFYWGGYLKFAPQALTDSLATLMQWHAQGKLSPHISHVLPLDRADDALALLRDRKSTGKVVVTP